MSEAGEGLPDLVAMTTCHVEDGVSSGFGRPPHSLVRYSPHRKEYRIGAAA